MFCVQLASPFRFLCGVRLGEYAILAPKRFPGLFETPDFLKTAFVASGYYRL